MKLDDFLENLESHREIEFHLNEKHFFLQPDWDNCKISTLYKLYQCESNTSKILFTGTINELVDFEFDDKYSFKSHFNYFSIDYVL